MVRAAAARVPAAGLGNAALRPVLAAPGPGVRAPRDALPHPARRLRRRGGAGVHRAGAAVPAVVPRGAHLLPARRASASSLEKLRSSSSRSPAISTSRRWSSPGEVCFRGGLIDLFPMGSALPYRLDLDDDVIDAIKTFDVDTQRTLYAVKEIRMLPAREFPLDDAGRAQLPQPLARAVRRRPVQEAPLPRRLERRAGSGHRVLPAAVLRAGRDAVRLPAGRQHARAAPRRQRRDPGLLARRRTRATRWRAATPTGRCLPPPQLFVPAEEFYVRAQAFRAHRPASTSADEERAARSAPRRCRRSRSTAARTIRSPR